MITIINDRLGTEVIECEVLTAKINLLAESDVQDAIRLYLESENSFKKEPTAYKKLFSSLASRVSRMENIKASACLKIADMFTNKKAGRTFLEKIVTNLFDSGRNSVVASTLLSNVIQLNVI